MLKNWSGRQNPTSGPFGSRPSGPHPPAYPSAILLRQALAWRAQEQDQGGLSREASLRLYDLRRGLARDPGDRACARTWKGERHLVYVMEDAFAWQGRTYRSLTAVAHAITGGALVVQSRREMVWRWPAGGRCRAAGTAGAATNG